MSKEKSRQFKRFEGAFSRYLLTSAWIIVTLFVCRPCVAQVAISAEGQEAIARFEAQIASDVAADDIGSITAAVVVGNEVIWAKGFGWADSEKKIQANRHTIYRVGSISKSVTAVLLMRLVEQGVFQLDDSVEKYFPEIKELYGYSAENPITFRQLANHTAGLIREPTLLYAAAGPISGWEDKIIDSIPTTSFFAPPGQVYQYSNIGYGILGLAISRAAKKPFTNLIHALIFEPLDMESSFFIFNKDTEKHLSVGYANRRNGTVNTAKPEKEHAGRGYKVPNGGVYSTVVDLSLFIAGQTGVARKQILNRESRAEMQRIQISGNTTQGYGLGFSIRVSDTGVRMIGHGGAVAGYTAYIVFDPESKIGVILLRNYNQGRTNLGRRAGNLLGELVKSKKG